MTPEIKLTPVALKRILNYFTNHPTQNAVRLSVKKTGCSGLSYVLDYVNEKQCDDLQLLLEDNHYLYVEKASYNYLKGLEIDYIKHGLNNKFVFNNPNQTGQCGCGESFTIN